MSWPLMIVRRSQLSSSPEEMGFGVVQVEPATDVAVVELYQSAKERTEIIIPQLERLSESVLRDMGNAALEASPPQL